jgi:protein TonB
MNLNPGGSMNTKYVLPVCFAAAAHGALLFGFSKNPRPPVTEIETRIAIPFRHAPPPDEVEVAVTDTQEKSSIAPARPVMPRSEEPLRIVTDAIPAAIAPPITVNVTDRITRVIDPGVGIDGGTGTKPWAGGVLGSAVLDNPPRTRFQASPLYPPEARRAGVAGTVTVEFVVDESGMVVDPRVTGSSDRVFEEASLRAVSKWRFEPGRHHGRIVRFRMAVPLVFSLNE